MYPAPILRHILCDLMITCEVLNSENISLSLVLTIKHFIYEYTKFVNRKI